MFVSLKQVSLRFGFLCLWGINLVFLLNANPACASDFPVPSLNEVSPEGVSGTLVICGGGRLPDEIMERFLTLAGGEESKLVVIPTASNRADTEPNEHFQKRWKDLGFKNVEILHTRDRKIADSQEFVAPLKTASAVWFVGGQQSKLGEAYAGTKFESELHNLLERDGVIGGTSAGAAIQSRLMIASGNPEAVHQQGLDLLPGAVIDQHFKARNRLPRLLGTLEKHSGYFGVGIDEGTALVVQGRKLEVLGDSTVTVCLPASQQREAKRYDLTNGQRADLTALQRAAISRSFQDFPPPRFSPPKIQNGSLLIIGGGKMTKELWEKFVELAGGNNANILVVPAATGSKLPRDRYEVKVLADLGVKRVSVLHAKDRDEANSAAFVNRIDQATGIWFTGGRQWRIVDAYEGTKAEVAFRSVLKRGGVIAGSSAGATIQGDYLVRGNPLGNQDMMAEGYERGFGYLPGVAIDQHFTQRKRHADLAGVKQTFPQLLCIGIDESTAMLVQGAEASVLGENDVYFFDANAKTENSNTSDVTQKTKVSPDQVYDLVRRTVQ